MEQQIRFCTTSDGVRIAYATVGSGPPLIFCPGIFSHLEADWQLPWRRTWYEQLARRCLLARYDGRGTGLSQRHDCEFSADALVADIGAVASDLGLERFALCGIVLGGASAILYSARHADRVSRLVLFGTAKRGTDLYTLEALAPLLSMARSNWRMASVLSSNLSTGAVSESVRLAEERYIQEAVDGETFARLLELSYTLDLTPDLPRVVVPSLVMHQHDDRVIPVEFARQLAASLPNSRFQSFDGESNRPWQGRSAEAILQAIAEFLELPPPERAEAPRSALVTILFTDMEGSTGLTQRLGDAKAQDVLRTHNAIVRDALKAHAGAEIKHTGDGVMASFPSASGALECAVAIQRAFDERNRAVGAGLAPPKGAASSAPTEAIRVRIGLNAGEPIAEEADLFGAAVQLAARVCARAEPGQVLASNVVRELAVGKGFLFADLGEVELRGFEDPVRLFEVRQG